MSDREGESTQEEHFPPEAYIWRSFPVGCVQEGVSPRELLGPPVFLISLEGWLHGCTARTGSIFNLNLGLVS